MFNILVSTLGILIFILCTVVTFSLGKGAKVSIAMKMTQGSQHQKKPVYIEWNGKELILHPQKLVVPLSLNIDNFKRYKQVYKMSLSVSN